MLDPSQAAMPPLDATNRHSNKAAAHGHAAIVLGVAAAGHVALAAAAVFPTKGRAIVPAASPPERLLLRCTFHMSEAPQHGRAAGVAERAEENSPTKAS